MAGAFTWSENSTLYLLLGILLPLSFSLASFCTTSTLLPLSTLFPPLNHLSIGFFFFQVPSSFPLMKSHNRQFLLRMRPIQLPFLRRIVISVTLSSSGLLKDIFIWYPVCPLNFSNPSPTTYFKALCVYLYKYNYILLISYPQLWFVNNLYICLKYTLWFE